MKIKSSSVGMNLAEVEERDVTCDMFNFLTSLCEGEKLNVRSF